MKVRLLLIISIIVLGLSGAYIVKLLNQDFVLSKESNFKATINLWTTTPELSSISMRFQEKENIKVNIKQFENSELLFEELELTKLNNDAPDLVEVSSLNEMALLKNDYAIFPVDGLADKSSFHPAAIENFSSEKVLYAYPLGIEVPTIYINRALVQQEVFPAIYPFQPEKVLKQYEKVQNDRNEKHPATPFWMLHFDDQLDWYWSSNQLAGNSISQQDFDSQWAELVKEYQLVPQLDSHMAITRFANSEIGTLISNSKHIQSLQQLIGNRFEFDINPFLMEEEDKIQVSGNGLAVLTDAAESGESIKRLFQYLSVEEEQAELLSGTGWLPAQQALLQSDPFIHQLPMFKHLQSLTKYQNNFIGMEIDGQKKVSKET